MFDTLSWGLGGLLVLITVTMHYETMGLVSDYVIPWSVQRFHGRRVIAIAIATLMLGHIAEIWLWAVTYTILLQFSSFGRFIGPFDGNFSSILYISAVSYTSLGENIIRPDGPIRAIVACESLGGLMMTAWTASFTYLKMEQIWKNKKIDQ